MQGFDHEALVERTSEIVAERPRQIVLAFFLLSLVFAAGLGNISTESGTSQFSEGSPSEEAFTDVQQQFGPTFAPDTGSTQLIQTDRNVLSKPAMLRMLEVQERVSERPALRVSSTSSAAQIVAQQLNPNATTVDAQIRAMEQATPSEIDAAVKRAASNPGFTGTLSKDFNEESARASATIAVVQHELPGGISSGAGTSGTSPLTAIQLEIEHVVDSVGGDIRVFGSGMISAEFNNVIVDSLLIVVPAASILIFAFLVYSYRDPFDLVLGVVSLVMAIVWTFGSMGLAGIPFTQMLIAVPPLLLAVGIDFGIHAVNRYREERVQGIDVGASMRTTTDQLLVAFFIVTGTTVLGFSANMTSSLAPIRDFGLIAAIGIVFTMLIFGIFLPAAKVWLDRIRVERNIPIYGGKPLGSEGSLLGRVLPVGVEIARRAPRVFLVVILLTTIVVGNYGAGVDTSFSQEDFLPPADVPDYLEALPEPFSPATYTVTSNLNFLEDNFESASGDQVTVYVEGPLRKDWALESIQHANRNPPSSIVTNGRQADTSSIIGVIQDYAAANPEFEALVDRNDIDNDGVPDDNLGRIYDELLDSPYRTQALNYITEDQRATRVVYSTKADASQAAVVDDAKSIAGDYRLHGVATGQTVVFQAISDTIFQSAITSLAVALIAAAIFLVLVYWLLEGYPSLGIVNLVPIVVTLALIIGTMRYLNVPLNALTATILSIAIGLGVDYSAHFTHRFVDEFQEHDVDDALMRTVRGTGGALTGSMATTAFGIGVLVLAITPILGQFGLVTSLAIVYSFLTSILITPAAVVVWADLTDAQQAAVGDTA